MKLLTCTVKTLKGLELPLVEELKAMDFDRVNPGRRAVEFETDLEGLYRCNLNVRTGISVLLNLDRFRFKDQQEIYDRVFKIDWENYFDVKQTFMVQSTVYSDAFNNSAFPALLVKDAIVDRFREKFNDRPNIDKERPDIVVDLYISENRCVVSLNSSGPSLYKRGYRNMPFPAPLNECLAAGLIYLSGWNGESDFFDPMCGSGTLLIEAAMMAYQIEPSALREEFAFKNWKNFDDSLFQKVKQSLEDNRISDFPFKIYGSDISNRAISICRQSLTALRLEDKVEIQRADFHKIKEVKGQGMIFINPPYGERMESEDLSEDFKKIGDTLKFNCANQEAWIIGPDTADFKLIGLKPFKKIDLINGKIPCKFCGYKLYKGSKKGED